jgi:uncharacterized membrane protein (DUF485 family)
MYTNTVKDEADLTDYGVLRSVQTQLSEIRTDLDSFSDAEAWALMYSGYVQTKYEWNRHTNETDEEGKSEDWQFLRIKEYMTLPAKAAAISKPLSEGKRLALKVFYLSRQVQMAALALSLVVLALLIYLVFTNWNMTLLTITVKFLVVTAIVSLLGLISKYLAIALNVKSAVRRYLMMVGTAIVGFVVSNIYLRWLNPVYNRAGKLKEEK